MQQTRLFKANGKLLVTGEYLVLRGAKSLALPVKLGQSLQIDEYPDDQSQIIWLAKAPGREWFRAHFSLPALDITATDDKKKAAKLQLILQTLNLLAPGHFQAGKKYVIETQLGFEPEWGFGSSSTLIANLASWAKINPYTLLQLSIGGSGYDVACAFADNPIIYQLNKLRPSIEEVAFRPNFRDKMFFVYLGKKQDSAVSVQAFKDKSDDNNLADSIQQINAITENLVSTNSFEYGCKLIEKHEQLIAAVLGKEPVKTLFPDFNGTLKSLGAWGGDFILAMSEWPEREVKEYFAAKGLKTFFTFDQLIKIKSFEK